MRNPKRPTATEVVTHCPYCGRLNELHQNKAGTRPVDGDVSICWLCRQIGVFTVGPLGLAVRLPTAEERAKLDADPLVRSALAAAAEAYDPDTAVDLWRGGVSGA